MTYPGKTYDFDRDPSGTIAMFIAAALQHPNPPCNGRQTRVSTIVVSQHKNKFNQVVVYCDLADPNEVSEAWAENDNEGDPTPEFIEKAWIHDAQHYRRCYQDMLFLVPQHRDIILSRPDYYYLLLDDQKALDEWLAHRDEVTDYRPEPESNAERLAKHWHSGPKVSTVDEVRDRLYKVYRIKK